MNTSVPGLPIATGVTGRTPGGEINNELIQLDGGEASGFTRVLGELYSQLSPASADSAGTAVDGEALLEQLQSLPDGGKLLPLLSETLDNAAAAGIDTGRLTERLAAMLEQLDGELSQTGLPPAGQLALLLQPLVQEQPALKAALPAEVAAALQEISAPSGRSASDATWRDLSLAAGNRPADSGADAAQASSRNTAARPPESQPTLLPQAAAGADSATADKTRMSALLEAMRRLSPEAPRAPAPVDAVQGAATTTAPTTAVSAGAGQPAVNVNTPLGQPGWDQALGERIQWLASQNVQGAQVKLNPANLGPMEVRIQVQNDQASVHFTSGHAVVRDALEAALPRLRDMFQASGVELVDVNVSGESFTGQQQAAGHRNAPSVPGFSAAADEPMMSEPVAQSSVATFLASGRLDLFA